MYFKDLTKVQLFQPEFIRVKFSFHSPRWLKSPDCPIILPITGGRIIGFITSPRIFVLCEMLHLQFEVGSSCPFPTTINIIPRTHVVY